MNLRYRNLKSLAGLLLSGIIAISSKAQSPVIIDPEVEQIATGFQFVEGPVWVDSLGLLFSDIPANKIYRWNPLTGQTSTYLEPSGNSNGLMADLDGNLLLAQHGNRRIAKIVNGVETEVVSRYRNNRLNSPNDIAIQSDGRILFTDPPYGINPNQSELGFSGVFRLSPDGVLKAIDSVLSRPNGIVFSPDGRKLYVNNSEEKKIYSWEVSDNSEFTNKEEFATLTGNGNADGMAVDAHGYVYSTGPGGVWVIAPDKTIINTIPIPGQTTNCTFGGPNNETLFVTSGGNVYRVTNNSLQTGIKYEEGSIINSPLQPNFPNPLTYGTTIPVNLQTSGNIKLQILSNQGSTIAVLADQYLKAGNYSFNWNPENNESGLYLIRLQYNGKTFTRNCIVKQ